MPVQGGICSRSQSSRGRNPWDRLQINPSKHPIHGAGHLLVSKQKVHFWTGKQARGEYANVTQKSFGRNWKRDLAAMRHLCDWRPNKMLPSPVDPPTCRASACCLIHTGVQRRWCRRWSRMWSLVHRLRHKRSCSSAPPAALSGQAKGPGRWPRKTRLAQLQWVYRRFYSKTWRST